MQTELVQLGIAIAVIVLILLVLRRASTKSKQQPASIRERLGVEPEVPERARRERKRPRPGQAKPKPAAAKPAPEPEPENDEEEQAEREQEPPKRAAQRVAEPEPVADEEAREAFKAGLAKTRGGFVAKLGKLFGKKKIDATTLEELEEVLFTADIGPRAAERIFQSVKTGLSKDELEDADKIWAQIRRTSRDILAVEAAPIDLGSRKPFVLLVLGVNGVGKTTTIGKLAKKLSDDGKKVILAAGDTFRAAATEQLEVWGDRAKVPVVKGKPNGDPSSVIFDAIKRGVDESFDIVICDTAGRLHSNAGLMD